MTKVHNIKLDEKLEASYEILDKRIDMLNTLINSEFVKIIVYKKENKQ